MGIKYKLDEKPIIQEDIISDEDILLLDKTINNFKILVKKYNPKTLETIAMSDEEIIDSVLCQVYENNIEDPELKKEAFDPQEKQRLINKRIEQFKYRFVYLINSSIDNIRDYCYQVGMLIYEFYPLYYELADLDKDDENLRYRDKGVDFTNSIMFMKKLMILNRLLQEYYANTYDQVAAHLFKTSMVLDNSFKNMEDYKICFPTDLDNSGSFLNVLKAHLSNFLSFNNPEIANSYSPIRFYNLHMTDANKYTNVKSIVKDNNAIFNAYDQFYYLLKKSYVLINVGIDRIVGTGYDCNNNDIVFVNDTGIYSFKIIENAFSYLDVNILGVNINNYTVRENFFDDAKDSARNLKYNLCEANIIDSTIPVKAGIVIMNNKTKINNSTKENIIFNLNDPDLIQYIEGGQSVLAEEKIKEIRSYLNKYTGKKSKHLVYENINTCISDWKNYDTALIEGLKPLSEISIRLNNQIKNILNNINIQVSEANKENTIRRSKDSIKLPFEISSYLTPLMITSISFMLLALLYWQTRGGLWHTLVVCIFANFFSFMGFISSCKRRDHNISLTFCCILLLISILFFIIPITYNPFDVSTLGLASILCIFLVINVIKLK